MFLPFKIPIWHNCTGLQSGPKSNSNFVPTQLKNMHGNEDLSMPFRQQPTGTAPRKYSENQSLEEQRYKTNRKRSKLIYKVAKHKQAKGYTNVCTATNRNKSNMV